MCGQQMAHPRQQRFGPEVIELRIGRPSEHIVSGVVLVLVVAIPIERADHLQT